jgi:hypothetical protein
LQRPASFDKRPTNPPKYITIDTINNAEELEAKTKAFVKSQEIPERHKTMEQLAADPNIGASSQCITFDTM